MSTTLRITGNASEEAQAWTQELAGMYEGWAALQGFASSRASLADGVAVTIECDPSACGMESGVHRQLKISRFDPKRRRHTAFAQVVINNDYPSTEFVRSYVFDPYLRVTDHRTGQQVDDAVAVMRGNLSLLKVIESVN